MNRHSARMHAVPGSTHASGGKDSRPPSRPLAVPGSTHASGGKDSGSQGPLRSPSKSQDAVPLRSSKSQDVLTLRPPGRPQDMGPLRTSRSEDSFHVEQGLYSVAAGFCGLDMPLRTTPDNQGHNPQRGPVPSRRQSTNLLMIPDSNRTNPDGHLDVTRRQGTRPHSFSGHEGHPDLLPKPRPFHSMLQRQRGSRRVRRIRFSVDAGAECVDVDLEPGATQLPWGAEKDKVTFPENIKISSSAKPGEFVLQTLFAEYTVLAEKKIEVILDLPPDHQKPLSKYLQRGEDATFDQVLSGLGSVAEHSLPSLLRCLFTWYSKQSLVEDGGSPATRQRTKSKSEKDPLDKKEGYILERREFAINFVYCLVLIEVLKQLPYHPGYDDLINHVITQAFRHFKYRDVSLVLLNTSSSGTPADNTANQTVIADLYAEVMGVLAHSRFLTVRKRFMLELKELKTKDQNVATVSSIINLLMGMKFFRVKMHPIEEFQACVQFLQELGNYFLEVKEKDIKHALAGLFVEILLPVSAVVKNEVNVPVLKNFVESMYPPTLDMSNKKKHNLALFPMVTCLLCVSQKQFFLNNWPYFLTICLSHLKDKETKTCRVALESLYRLVWVYMVRVKCESNTATISRLHSIVSSLFPKGSKVIVPRDAPLNIFVKIIQFIAQERLDFAMKEIIFDLLCVGRPIRNVIPERMSIGLRAFLVIADCLQQKEGDPPMPQTMGVMPSGNTLRFKKTFINKYLSDEQARGIGMSAYYPHVRKAFDAILKTLDAQIGKPLLRTRMECLNREPEEIITGDRKPKIDLFRTCVAAIPRLLPDGMSQHELIALLCRLTIHIDDELGKLAFQSLQNIIADLPVWRNDVVRGFVQFTSREITDSFSQLLDQCSRRIISMLSQWKTVVQNHQNPKEMRDKSTQTGERMETLAQQRETLANKATMHEVEGFALVMLCSCKPIVRKLAGVILKEVRNLFNLLNIPKELEPCVLDVMDTSCPVIIERFLPHLPLPEKIAVLGSSSLDIFGDGRPSTAALSAPSLDFQWLADRTSIIWTSAGYHDIATEGGGSMDDTSARSWIECMYIFMHHDYLMGHCPTAIRNAWPILFSRLQLCYKEHIDPSNTQNERASGILSRPGTKKVTSERDLYISLWQNYIVMACCIVPSSHSMDHLRSISPDLSGSGGEGAAADMPPKSPGYHSTAKDLFKILVPLIRCETSDIMEAVVMGLGHTNPEAFRDLVEELLPIIKEAIDRKQENVRRRKRRDVLRLALVKVFRAMAEHGIFNESPSGVIEENNALCFTFVEYIEGARQFLDSENDKDAVILQDIRLHFSEFVRHLIRNTPVEKRGSLLSRELRYSLFYLFASWSGKFGLTFGHIRGNKEDRLSELQLSAVQAMSAVLCCGPVFDPTGLNEDGYIYAWLDTLLAAHEEKIYKLAQETVVLLLEFNPDVQTLLEWVIDRCYTGAHDVSDGCFSALAMVFNNREYPCDHVAMLNLTLLNTGCPRVVVHETAVQLLHLLYKRFFLDSVIVTEQEGAGDRDTEGGTYVSVEKKERAALQELLLSGPYSRAQLFLSETLARLHPDLTMPMFSEITHRFQTAKPAIRQTLLQYLLPWLQNIELVDPNLQQGHSPMNYLNKPLDDHPDYIPPPLRGEGWGSPQATEMVLNNLLYITAKFGDDHAKEIEDVWASLVACRPNNLKVILRYVFIITGTAPANILPHTKRIIVYLGRAKPERLVDEVMIELQTVESLIFNVERTQTPPYYRFTKKQSSSHEEPEPSSSYPQHIHLDKGQIHTKRHSAEDPQSKLQDEMTPRTNSTASLRSEASTVSSVAVSVKTDSELEETLALCTPKTGTGEVCMKETPVPYPLPMPAYGGYFAPIYELLPAGDLPNPPYQRCNLAVMLLTDLVMDCIGIDWTVHLPLMLHIIFLGLDHSRYLIHEHCKKLLLNLLLVMSSHNDHFSVAKIILSNRTIHEETSLTLPNTINRDLKDISFVEGMESSGEGGPSTNQSVTSSGTIATDSVSSLVDVDLLPATEDVAKALIDFLVTRKCRPLWSYEDITAKVHSIKSAEQLEHFLKYVLRVFRESVPLAHIEQRWPQVALQLALSCPSRHYAGRSFQIFRALHIPLTCQMLSDVLSRLVETVADHGEDMQGYVTEIMLTLESTIDHLNADFRTFDFAKELFMSTPNLTKEPKLEIKKSATVALRQAPPYRSTSYALAAITRRTITSAPVPVEVKIDTRQHRCSTGDIETRGKTNLSRSRSVQSLKNATQEVMGQEDKLTILSQLFFVGLTLLESDYEYEFLMAVRLLDKVLRHVQPERPECREKLDKIQSQLKWPTFPGVQSLLLKGCTSSITAEATWTLLSRLTLCIQAPIIDPSQGIGFPMNVMSLLPYLVLHYEEPTSICSEAADHISHMCMEQPGKLDNLATVMQLYSRGTFGKDKYQWTKCVVKYIYDVYSNLSSFITAFLVEVLDKGPSSSQSAVLQILHCMVHYIDLTTPPYNTLNGELMRVVAKYMESQHWREALKILKLCVTKTSSLTMPPPGPSSSVNLSALEPAILSLPAHTSFAEADISFKKELPGRTIDFTFDMSQVNIIGRHLLELPSPAHDDHHGTAEASTSKDRTSLSLSPSMSINDGNGPPGWKTPQPCQKRLRERLVNLLNAYGQTGQIVGLRTSSSVIFSQSSDTMERQASKSTSSEEASVNDIPGDDSSMEQHMRVFDFLNDELDEMMSEGDQFNQGLQPHHQDTDIESKEDCSSPGSHKGEGDVSSDDECMFQCTSPSPVDEYLPDMRTSSTITLQHTMLEPNRRHSISGSSHSLHSDASVPDISDLSPSRASPQFSSMSAILSIQNDELEEVWRSHVRRVIMDEPATQNVNTFHLFARLFQEIQRKVQTLTQDSCFILSRTDQVKGLANLLSGLLDIVNLASQCPLVYADGETLSICKMVEQHKFNILEINEIYETYLMRKDKAVEVLEGLKSSLKQQSLGESQDEVPGEDQSELCWCLYRLHFQLLQLYDSYSKLVASLRTMPKPPEVVDLSDEVGRLRDELQQAQTDVDNDTESSPLQLDLEHVTRSEGEKMIVEAMTEGQHTKAVRLLRGCRRIFQGDVFGAASDEVETMLFIYCKFQAEAKPGIVAITDSKVDLCEVKQRLMEVKVQLSTAMMCAPDPPPPGEPPGELPRVETEVVSEVSEAVSEGVSEPTTETETLEEEDSQDTGQPTESISL